MVRNLDQGIPTWVGSLLILVGFVLALLIVRDVRMLVQGKRSTGVITDVRRSGRSGLVPVVRFATTDGRYVTFRGFPLNSGYEIGQVVPVIYRPADPIRAEIYSWRTFWVGFCFVVVAAAGLVAGGIAIVRSSERARNRDGTSA